MSEGNSKEINVLSTYSDNMEFLSKVDVNLYNKIRRLEIDFENNSNLQKYILKFNKTYFDVYHKESESFLYNQESNIHAKNIVNQIVKDEDKNNFKPYIPLIFDEDFIKDIEDMDLMSNEMVAAAPIINYANKNEDKKFNNENINKFMFLGVSLGLHIAQVHKELKCKVYFICEPDLELFRLSLFTTAYNEIAQNSDLIFSIGDSDLNFQEKCDLFLNKRYMLNYNIKYNLFSLRAARLIKLFQTAVTAQSFITYSYPRCFMASQRPLGYSVDKFNFLDVSIDQKRTSDLSNNPVLVLGAGPSLLKNIQWLKDNQNKFMIITVASNIKLLYKHSIKPDIIIQIDEVKETNLKLFVDVDMDFFSQSLVILSSIIHPEIIKKYEKNTKFIIQAIATYYNDLDKLFSLSIGEVSYAFSLLYGSKSVYLLGLDFSLDPITNQSHSKYHFSNSKHEDIKDGHKHDELSLSKNYLSIKGNLREKLYTTSLLYASIPEFNYFTEVLKPQDANIYNLSDGAYLENTNPLDINTFTTDDFSSLNKSEIKVNLEKELTKNSRSELSVYDKKMIKRKIKNAKYIRQLIKLQMSKTNYKEVKNFLYDIEELTNKIITTEDKTNSVELNRILYEYTRLVGPYVYNLCEQYETKTEGLTYVKNMNEIFTSQLIKITDKYSDTIQGFMNKI